MVKGTLPPSIIKKHCIQIGDTECSSDYVMISGGWGGTEQDNKYNSKDRYTLPRVKNKHNLKISI